MKRITLAILALLALLYAAPASFAAETAPRDAEIRDARVRERDALVPRLARAIAKRLGLIQGNVDAPLPPRP